MSCICCFIRSRATTFSAPLGIITSAYFLVGMQNSSKAGLTRVVYWWSTWTRSRPRSSISLRTLLASLVSACINKQLQVEELPYLGEIEHKDTLHHHHVGGVDRCEL